MITMNAGYPTTDDGNKEEIMKRPYGGGIVCFGRLGDGPSLEHASLPGFVLAFLCIHILFLRSGRSLIYGISAMAKLSLAVQQTRNAKNITAVVYFGAAIFSVIVVDRKSVV